MKSVTIIGAGRVGGAFAISLSRAGYRIEQLIYRSAPPTDSILELIHPNPSVTKFDQLKTINSDIVLITTGDEEIASVAVLAVPFMKPGTVVLHTSGSLSSEELAPLAEAGCPTGSMHPLLAVSDPVRGAESFVGAYFCLEGVAEAVEAAEAIVESLGGRPFSIETQFKPLYHAAAVMSAGHVTALFGAAVDTLARCGLAPEKAQQALLPLLNSTVANLSNQSPSDALTGPFVRGDVPAVERHLAAFDTLGLAPEKRLYAELGEFALKLAKTKGTDAEKASRIARAIKLALESVR